MIQVIGGEAGPGIDIGIEQALGARHRIVGEARVWRALLTGGGISCKTGIGIVLDVWALEVKGG
jgi:hypothetical protein